jgi:cytosine deaminase
MANLYANVAQVAAESELAICLDLISSSAARIMRLKEYGIAPGSSADMIVPDATSPAQAVAEIAQPLSGVKRGRVTFERPTPRLTGRSSNGQVPIGLRSSLPGRLDLVLCFPSGSSRRQASQI